MAGDSISDAIETDRNGARANVAVAVWRAIRRWVGTAAAHPLTPAVGAIILTALVGFAPVFSEPPLAERQWTEHLARTAHAELGENQFSVAPVRDWSYDASGPVSKIYGDAAFALPALRNVWFMLEPRPGSEIAAHTLLLFEFEDDRLLGLTIEARRESDETFSAWQGVWNTYELAYVWASARDLLTRRAVFLDHDVYVYPLRISYAQKVNLLTRLLQTTADLEATPRFYNTFFSNCTNELAKRADLTWDSAFILTGLSDDHLHRVGVIPGATFEDAKARADMRDVIRSLNHIEDAAAFDAALLAELRARRSGGGGDMDATTAAAP